MAPPTNMGRADQHGLVDEELTREVIGGYYYVYNTMGYGFVESVYGKALYIELRRRGLRVKREVTVNRVLRELSGWPFPDRSPG
jgi:hypothetical protein